MKDALQGLVGRKLLDMMEYAASVRGNIEDPFGRRASPSGLLSSRVNVHIFGGNPLIVPFWDVPRFIAFAM